ncbi:transposable element Tcb2 transposase [Trichonephila clavipes]|nr:transposable element Tcb2 transposase [Trichonephila clavipes]
MPRDTVQDLRAQIFVASEDIATTQELFENTPSVGVDCIVTVQRKSIARGLQKCWDQGIREMSFTRRQGSGRPRLASLREDCRIVRNARVQPTASSATIQALVAPSLGTPIFSNYTKAPG